jgi:hypothetical protein
MEDGMTETTTSNAPTPAPAPAVETPAPVSGSDTGEERNPVFEMLVSGDNDIIGLVAYSIYKQNKRDWLIAFSAARGREPSEEERLSYIIGDSTPRRLATFRHLAQATLEGRGPDVPFEPGQRLGPDGVPRNYPIAQRPRLSVFSPDLSSNNTRASFIALVVVALVAVYLAARFGLPGVTH